MSYYDITEMTLMELGFLGSGGSGGSLVPANIRWDCSIGGIPFIFGIDENTPFRRETSEFRRQRIDQERNPGEQSLDSGFWIRSQNSWHYGSGLSTAEPLEVNDNESQFRYRISGGIDPWNPGTVTMLHATASVVSASATGQALLGVDGGVLHAAGSTLRFISTSGSATTISWGGSAAIASITSDGSNWYAANSDGIYKGALPAGAGSKIWDTGSPTLIRWVKSRLMATVGKGIYELTASAGPALPSPLDPGTTRPSGWTWTDITEGPAAMYLSGYAGDQSTIEKVTVESTTTTVTLSVPVVVAEMPRTELVRSLYSVVGSFLAVGTSKGMRVADIGDTGNLTMGPVIVEAADGVTDSVAIDSFVYFTVGAQGYAGNGAYRAGLYRMDLGRTINNSALQFASAPDLVAPAGVSGGATQVTLSGGKLWFAVDGAGVFKEQDTFVDEGWIETGRIRLGTVEPKSWQDVRLIGVQQMPGTATAFVSTDGNGMPSSWVQSVTITGTDYDSRGTLGVVSSVPYPDLYVAIRLRSANSGTLAPTLNGFQVRAIPAPARTELLSVPLLTFDFIVDRNGARFGKTGNGYALFKALKTLESTSATIQFRDFTTGEQVAAYIERVSYTRVTPPTRQVSGNGGITTVLLRTVS